MRKLIPFFPVSAPEFACMLILNRFHPGTSVLFKLGRVLMSGSYSRVQNYQFILLIRSLTSATK